VSTGATRLSIKNRSKQAMQKDLVRKAGDEEIDFRSDLNWHFDLAS